MHSWHGQVQLSQCSQLAQEAKPRVQVAAAGIVSSKVQLPKLRQAAEAGNVKPLKCLECACG
jgi:hypothetical protein